MQDQLRASKNKRMKPIASKKHENELNNFYPDARVIKKVRGGKKMSSGKKEGVAD